MYNFVGQIERSLLWEDQCRYFLYYLKGVLEDALTPHDLWKVRWLYPRK